MSDETQQGEASSEIEVTPSAETPAADSQPETKQEPEKPAEGASQEPEKKEPSAPAGEPATEPASQEPEKPKSRRSAQFRIEQLARENANLRRQNNLPPRKSDEDQGDPQQDESKQQQPDVDQLVDDRVQKHLKPVITQAITAADDAELNELFTGDLSAQRQAYEPKIRKMWELPQYKDVPASDLYRIAAFDGIASQAVEQSKKAEKEAKESSTGGTSARKGDKSQSAWDLSEEEFKKKNDEVRASG